LVRSSGDSCIGARMMALEVRIFIASAILIQLQSRLSWRQKDLSSVVSLPSRRIRAATPGKAEQTLSIAVVAGDLIRLVAWRPFCEEWIGFWEGDLRW
jgi:hypothetical protein